jgi:tungstate transport system ATP-binding protein
VSDLPLFSLEGVRVVLGGREVLSIPQLRIPPGRVTVLLGENGSGKTTLLRLLNGLASPAVGSVAYRGAPLAAAEGQRRIRAESVLVHQSVVLFRGSVYQNVAYGLGVRGVRRSEIPGRVARALALVGLAGFERRRASALSGGERQRVAIARALALETPVLFLDEPNASVDAESRLLVEETIRRLSATGATVIISSHAVEFAYRLADELLLLEAGRVSPGRENVLRGRVSGRDEQFTYFASGSCTLRCPARDGEFVTAVLPMDDVILSREPLVSSARNQLRGRVTAVEPLPGDGGEGSLLRVTVDCGVPIRALITRSAARELEVEAGRVCMLTFKASAVRLF